MPQPHKDRITHTLEQHAHRHIEDIIEPVGLFLVPIFFILTSMQVRIDALFNLSNALLVLGLTAAAVVGKLVAGLGARNANKLIVSIGMIPRGEVGLIFATIGRGLGVVSETAFSVIVVMVILTTILTPPILVWLLKRQANTVPAIV